MLAAVRFDRELLFRTIKVNNEASDRHLSSEFEATNLTIAQPGPKPALSVSRFMSHDAGETAQAPRWIAVGWHSGILPKAEEPSPYPLPAYRERGKECIVHARIPLTSSPDTSV